jgi:hypothetical protein
MVPGFGVSPDSLFLIPQEWGIKGVEVRAETLLVGIAHPATLVVWM